MPSRLKTASLLFIALLLSALTYTYLQRAELIEGALTAFLRAKKLGELELKLETLNFKQISFKDLHYKFSSEQFRYQVLLPGIKVYYQAKSLLNGEIEEIEINTGRLLISKSETTELDFEFKPSVKALRFYPALEIEYQIEITSKDLPTTEQLRAFVKTWPENLELLSGRFKMNLNLSYPLKKGSNDSLLSVNVTDVSAQFGQQKLAGGSLELKDQMIEDPLALSGVIMLRDLGLAELASDLKAKIKVESLAQNDYRLIVNPELKLLGAVLSSEPLAFSKSSSPKSIDLTLSSLNLAHLATLYKHQQLELEGLVDAFLPLKLALSKQGKKNIEIRNGKVKSLGPGVIRYKLAAQKGGAMELATQALSNIHYDMLEAELNMDSNGDLKLKVHIQGKNPDLDLNRPIVLNIALEENVYQMLKSVSLMQMKRDTQR